MKKGLLIIMSGPSGVGKGTIRKKVMEDESLNLFFSVSMTTRLPRNGEVDGVDYYYVSKEEFVKKIEENGFLEYNYFVSNYYGTPRDKVEELREKGINVILEIDVNGAEQVMKNYEGDDLVSIFILPPSIKELEDRIRGRKTESEDVIQERLSKAAREISLAGEYKYSVVNDDLEASSRLVRDILIKEIEKVR